MCRSLVGGSTSRGSHRRALEEERTMTTKQPAGTSPAATNPPDAAGAAAHAAVRQRLRLRRLAIAAAAIVAFGAMVASAAAAISITRPELNGSQLRVEGRGALPNAKVTVDPGGITSTSDSSGAFRNEAPSYSSSTCRVTVSDGATSATASFSGCTPSTTSPPPPTSAPAVSLSPASLTFASRDTGTTSPPQSLTVTNTGTAPLFINSAALGSGDTLDFTVVGDGCSGLTLAVGASCGLSVTFS